MTYITHPLILPYRSVTYMYILRHA